MKLSKNLFEHTLKLLQDIVIPEPYDTEATLLEYGRSTRVVIRHFEMLTSVQFDDDMRFQTDEVHDESGNWILTPELEIAEASAA